MQGQLGLNGWEGFEQTETEGQGGARWSEAGRHNATLGVVSWALHIELCEESPKRGGMARKVKSERTVSMLGIWT